LNNPEALVNALALQIQLLSRQGQPEQAQEELAELVLISRRETLRGESFFRAQHSQALAHLARGNLATAASCWQQIIDLQAERAVAAKLITGTLHWLALCRQQQGELSEARHLMQQSLEQAQAQNNPRRVARNQIALASFALDQGQLELAQTHLAAAGTAESQPDQEQRAHYLYIQGRLQLAQGKLGSGRQVLQEARDLFERMGMEPEARTTRAELEWVAER
jgi:tetratricopeptide (TPR) repeat protein